MESTELHIICPNPALEITYKVDSLELKELTDAREIHYAIGGKAINVSRILTKCNIRHILFCPLGGDIGGIISSGLLKESVEFQSIPVEEETRVSVVINDGVEQKVIRTNGNTSLSNYDEIFFSALNRFSESPTVCVLSGSLPMFLSSNFYTKLMEMDIYKKCKFFIDTSQMPLIDLIGLNPYFITPNKLEAEKTLGYKLLSEEDIIKAIHEFISLGAVNVVITLGKDGAICIMDSILYRIKTFADENRIVNSIGAGDALMAGLIDSELKVLDSIDYLRNAFAFAVASLFSETSGNIEVELMSPKNIIIQINTIHEN